MDPVTTNIFFCLVMTLESPTSLLWIVRDDLTPLQSSQCGYGGDFRPEVTQ
jgi:hypothetical protein